MGELPVGLATPGRARMFKYVVTSVLLLALLHLPNQSASHGNSSAANQTSFAGLRHKVGVYHLVDARDVPRAKRAGFEMVLARSAGGSPLTVALKGKRMGYIDATVQSLLYRAYCPTGRGSCKPLSLLGHLKLAGHVRSHVRKLKAAGGVAAYYVLDDYYTDMAPGLSTVRGAIRSVDPSVPTMCGFYQDLAYGGRDGKSVVLKKVFTEALRNYSPRWCDAVGIYAYAPSSFTRFVPARPTVEWGMRSTLPWVMASLRSKGWDSTQHVLVGMPGAFGYQPRTGRPGQAPWSAPQWRYAPTSVELATQVEAFCRAGATAILPYVWNDNSPGTAYGLHNSASLRSGVQSGVRACRLRYWK